MKPNEFLKHVHTVITKSLNTPELLYTLRLYGYDETIAHEGSRLYEGAKQLTQLRRRAIRQDEAIAYTLRASQDRLTALFQQHLHTIRQAYQREVIYVDHRKRTQTPSDNPINLLAQTEEFYANIPGEWTEEHIISPKELAEATQLVERVKGLVALQRQLQARIQSLTNMHEAALADLQAWMQRFRTIAEDALDEDLPQLEVYTRIAA